MEQAVQRIISATFLFTALFYVANATPFTTTNNVEQAQNAPTLHFNENGEFVSTNVHMTDEEECAITEKDLKDFGDLCNAVYCQNMHRCKTNELCHVENRQYRHLCSEVSKHADEYGLKIKLVKRDEFAN